MLILYELAQHVHSRATVGSLTLFGMETSGARTTRTGTSRRSPAWRARRIVTALSVTGFVALGGCLAATHKNDATTSNATGSSSSATTSTTATSGSSSSGSVSASGSQSATSGSSQSTTHGS